MRITEQNVRRLVAALGMYASKHNGLYPPVDHGAMIKVLGRVQLALTERGTDTQSRVNLLFDDPLPGLTQPLINVARALTDYDENVATALAYLDGEII
jgi:hypothetical protein